MIDRTLNIMNIELLYLPVTNSSLNIINPTPFHSEVWGTNLLVDVEFWRPCGRGRTTPMHTTPPEPNQPRPHYYSKEFITNLNTWEQRWSNYCERSAVRIRFSLKAKVNCITKIPRSIAPKRTGNRRWWNDPGNSNRMYAENLTQLGESHLNSWL